jgi:hypothetical protein
MALTRYDPWTVVSPLQNEINRVFGDTVDSGSSSATAEWVPARPLSVERGQHVASNSRWMQHLARIAALHRPILPAVLRQPSARHVPMSATAAARGA